VVVISSMSKESMMPRSTVTSKGQVTIPKAIRERLGLAVGDKLEFTVDEEGRIVARPDEVGDGVFGILRDLAPDRPLSIEQINEAARRGAVRTENGRGE
jgi:AbrB family looped-hinge helix DNA binding protein